MKVKYLHTKQIDNKAFEVLTTYNQRFGEIKEPPIPVEAIIESLLEMDFSIDDLNKNSDVPDILGATWIDNKRVIIDERLSPDEYPDKEGRYRFTGAHEIGHWVLHRHQITESRYRPLLDNMPAPSIVCRVSKSKEPIEWQADQFASYLLMPKEMVLAAWQQRFGNLAPYVAVDEIAELTQRFNIIDGRIPTVQVAKDIARDVFKTSAQAMQIRLMELGLILKDKPEPTLF